MELRSLGMGDMADPKIHAPPDSVHLCNIGTHKGVRINRRNPKN